MKRIRLLPIGDVALAVLDALCDPIEHGFGRHCVVDRQDRLDPSFAFHAERRQYHSSEILDRIAGSADEHTLGIAAVDLYIPILTFVFGEAEAAGGRAIVSFHRLRQEFYGLPVDHALQAERLLKEAFHELGHVQALHHCDDNECVMASSHAVEWIDVKRASFCRRCERHLREISPGSVAAAILNSP